MLVFLVPLLKVVCLDCSLVVQVGSQSSVSNVSDDLAGGFGPTESVMPVKREAQEADLVEECADDTEGVRSFFAFLSILPGAGVVGYSICPSVRDGRAPGEEVLGREFSQST